MAANNRVDDALAELSVLGFHRARYASHEPTATFIGGGGIYQTLVSEAYKPLLFVRVYLNGHYVVFVMPNPKSYRQRSQPVYQGTDFDEVKRILVDAIS